LSAEVGVLEHKVSRLVDDGGHDPVELKQEVAGRCRQGGVDSAAPQLPLAPLVAARCIRSTA